MTSLHPQRFEPIYRYRPRGGHGLSDLKTAPLPEAGPIGEPVGATTMARGITPPRR